MNNNIKILYIHDGKQNLAFNRRSTIDFIKKLRKYCDVYIHTNLENINSLIREVNPNILLLPEYPISRFFNFDLKSVTIPKVVIDIDFWDLDDKNWYINNGIDFVISRYSNITDSVPSVWLPFSVDEDKILIDIDSNYLDNRINFLTFVGSGRYSNNKYYFTRQKALKLLEQNDMIDYIGEIGYDLYFDTIKRYNYALSCSFPPLYKAPTKIYEIMSCGTLCLTTKIEQKEKLFGKEEVYLEYTSDCNNLIDVIKDIYSMNKKEIYRITRNALNIIQKHHLDKYRVKELYNILKNIVNDKQVYDRWNNIGIYE
jgi:hypothetical protein